MSSRLSENMSEKMRDIIHRFVSRTERFKERAIQPPTPSTGEHTTTGQPDMSLLSESK